MKKITLLFAAFILYVSICFAVTAMMVHFSDHQSSDKRNRRHQWTVSSKKPGRRHIETAVVLVNKF